MVYCNFEVGVGEMGLVGEVARAELFWMFPTPRVPVPWMVKALVHIGTVWQMHVSCRPAVGLIHSYRSWYLGRRVLTCITNIFALSLVVPIRSSSSVENGGAVPHLDQIKTYSRGA